MRLLVTVVRPLLVAAVATALVAVIGLLLAGQVLAPLPRPLTFDVVVVRACCLALAGCLLWGWAAVVAVVAESLSARLSRGAVLPGPHRGLILPTPVRRLVLTLCGVALVAATTPSIASAATGPDPASGTLEAIAATLPFPDRATDQPVQHRPHREHDTHITVHPGDTLWSLTAALLDTEDAETVGRRWPELYRANRAVIGADPDRIDAGQRLSVPRSLR